MTDEQTALRDLLAKGTDASFLREMIGFAAERRMELEVGALTGAAHGERPPDGWRSGMGTASGTGVDALRSTGRGRSNWLDAVHSTPKLRRGSCFPSSLGAPAHRRAGL